MKCRLKVNKFNCANLKFILTIVSLVLILISTNLNAASNDQCKMLIKIAKMKVATLDQEGRYDYYENFNAISQCGHDGIQTLTSFLNSDNIDILVPVTKILKERKWAPITKRQKIIYNLLNYNSEKLQIFADDIPRIINNLIDKNTDIDEVFIRTALFAIKNSKADKKLMKIIYLKYLNSTDHCSKYFVEFAKTIGPEVRTELLSIVNNWSSKGVGSAIKILAKLDEKSISPLLASKLHKNVKPESFKAIIQAFSNFNKLRAMPDQTNMSEEKPSYTEEIIMALGKIGDERALNSILSYCLISILKNNYEFKNYRNTTISSLGKLGNLNTIPVIKFLYYIDPYNRSHKDSAIINIIQRNRNAPFQSLLNIAFTENLKVRSIIIKILRLRNYIPKTREDYARWAILTKDWKKYKILKMEIWDLLTDLLNNENEEVRLDTINIIRELRIKLIQRRLVDRLRDRSLAVRIAAFDLLKENGWEPKTNKEKILYNIAAQNWKTVAGYGEEALPYILDFFRDDLIRPREDTRWQIDMIPYVLRAIGKPAIKHFLERKSKYTLMTLSKIDIYGFRVLLAEVGKNNVDYILSRLHDNNSRIRQRALSALIEINDKKYAPKIVDFTIKHPEEIDFYVYKYLAECNTEIIEKVLKYYNSPDKNLRALAARLLENKPLPQYIHILDKLSQDNEEMVYEPAITALGKIKDSEAIEIVKNILISEDFDKFRIAISNIEIQFVGYLYKPYIKDLLDNNNNLKRLDYIISCLQSLGWKPTTESEMIKYYLYEDDITAASQYGEKALGIMIEMFKDSRVYKNYADFLIKNGYKPANEKEEIMLLLALNKTAEVLQMGDIAVPYLIELYKKDLYADNIINIAEKLNDKRFIEPIIQTKLNTIEFFIADDVLKKLTGRKIDRPQEEWQKWWKKNKHRYKTN